MHALHLPDHARRMFAYERWAGGRVLDSFDRARRHLEHDASAHAADASPFVRAVEIHAHVQAARRIWLSRVAPDLADMPNDGLFPAWSLDRTREAQGEMDEAWDTFAGRLDAESLAGVVSYTTTEGTAMQSVLVDILVHVITHSAYHRGQIARLVAECGVDPAVTDFIFFAREGH